MKLYNYTLALLFTFALVGCAHSAAGNEEEHAHDESLRLTAYNDELEVFAEAAPFVVGRPSDILAHFTHLSDFKPLQQGRITLSLIVGTEGIRQQITQPLRSGIYKFTLTPAIAGTGKLIIEVEESGRKSQLTVNNVKVFSNEHDAQHAAADSVISSSSGLIFTKEQSWKVDFATAVVRPEPFGSVVRTVAQVLSSPVSEQVLVAKAAGVVRLTGNLLPGMEVRSGQTLMHIDNGGFASDNLETRYHDAETEYLQTRKEFERKKVLAVDKIVSERELLEAESAYKKAQSVFTSLKSNFSQGRQQVSASQSGVVKSVMVDNGEAVEAGQPLLSVFRPGEVLLKAEVQSKYYPQLSPETSATLTVTETQQRYSLEQLRGRLISYGKSTDRQNPLLPVVFQVENSIGLLPGSFVELNIRLTTDKKSLVVPNEAIVEEMGAHIVYVQLTPEYFEKRIVTPGATDGLRTVIREGISEGERVVSKGAIIVKLSQATGQLDTHGHVH